MWTWTPSPVALSLGPLAIRWYGLAYVAGFLASYWALRRSSLREHADDLLLAIMLGSIIGGRLGEFVFYSPGLLFSNPLEVFRIWHGGMSFHGGLIGVCSAVGFVAWRRGINFLRLADILVLPATLALALGRLANFLNGELLGTSTTVPWCVVVDGLAGCRHPSPLYEALYTALIAVVLTVLILRRVARPIGALFGTFLVLYGVLRFVANIWREDVRWLGISMGQYLSLVTAVVGAWLLWQIHKKRARGSEHYAQETPVRSKLQGVRRSARAERRRARP